MLDRQVISIERFFKKIKKQRDLRSFLQAFGSLSQTNLLLFFLCNYNPCIGRDKRHVLPCGAFSPKIRMLLSCYLKLMVLEGTSHNSTE